MGEMLCYFKKKIRNKKKVDVFRREKKENEKNVNPFSRAQFDFHISHFIAVDFLQLRAPSYRRGWRDNEIELKTALRRKSYLLMYFQDYLFSPHSLRKFSSFYEKLHSHTYLEIY